VLVLLLVFVGTPVSAFASSCSITDVSSSQACIGPVSGNDSASLLNSYNVSGAFGINQWVFAEKIEADDGGPERETAIDVGFDMLPPLLEEMKSGVWKLNSNIFDNFDNVALVLKAGPEFSAYLLDGSSTIGVWSTQGWTKKSLSHASVYVVSSVPIPAALWLFGSGLVGLATFSRRKK
jgi:hypothetical protein